MKSKKIAKEKPRKDKNKTKNFRKLEYSTDDSSGDERVKKTRKHKTVTESDSTSNTSSEKSNTSDDSQGRVPVRINTKMVNTLRSG